MIPRDAAAFVYTPGNAISNFAAPEGFMIAKFQNGEVTQTRFVLVERIPEESGGIVNSVKSFGATLGINKKEDYMLVNIDDGSKIPFNVDASGKEVAVHSECRKKNSFVNKCAKLDSIESLFNEHGLPNAQHYFWRLSWFAGDSGTIAIVREGSSVYIQNLKSGKKIEAFRRVMGINWLVANRTADNKIAITAQLGFSKEIVDDAEKMLEESKQAAEQSEQK